jgi:uncharacterized small protein (DUF1192 family)
VSEPERYGTCSDANGHWGIEDDGKVILSGLVSHDACDAVMDILDERDALKAEVERLTADLNKMTKTPDGVDYVEVDVGFWNKSGSRLPSSYSTFWSNDKGVQS